MHEVLELQGLPVEALDADGDESEGLPSALSVHNCQVDTGNWSLISWSFCTHIAA